MYLLSVSFQFDIIWLRIHSQKPLCSFGRGAVTIRRYLKAGVYIQAPTCQTAKGKLPATHFLNEPDSHECENEVGESCHGSQPYCKPVIFHTRHLQDGGTVVPVSKEHNDCRLQLAIQGDRRSDRRSQSPKNKVNHTNSIVTRIHASLLKDHNGGTFLRDCYSGERRLSALSLTQQQPPSSRKPSRISSKTMG